MNWYGVAAGKPGFRGRDDMNIEWKDFKRRKDFLICIDSDGCAMDTMDIKHIRCFGPCMVEEWGLERWADTILNRWNEINLYTMTRGINRFLGLAMALKEINDIYCPIDGIEEYEAWTKEASELSNHALETTVLTAKGPCLTKALAWSYKVNAAVDALPDEDIKPFEGVAGGLAAAHTFADVAIVSSANREAVMEEWKRCGLLPYVDVLCCQDTGSKEYCIKELKAQGYLPDHILMVGDAPGDAAAAFHNGVYFYPILVKHEHQSWKEFCEIALEKLKYGNYSQYGEEVYLRFLRNLE